MELKLITANLADLETECLITVALDHGDKQKPAPRLALKDSAPLDKAVADLISAGEITAKAGEAVLLHRPQGLKAKRLLVVGGGKANSFNASEVRKAAGAGIRYLKGRSIKSSALALPEVASGAE